MLAQGVTKNPKSRNNSFIANSVHFLPLGRAPRDSVPVTRILILNMLKLFWITRTLHQLGKRLVRACSIKYAWHLRLLLFYYFYWIAFIFKIHLPVFPRGDAELVKFLPNHECHQLTSCALHRHLWAADVSPPDHVSHVSHCSEFGEQFRPTWAREQSREVCVTFLRKVLRFHHIPARIRDREASFSNIRDTSLQLGLAPACCNSAEMSYCTMLLETGSRHECWQRG